MAKSSIRDSSSLEAGDFVYLRLVVRAGSGDTLFSTGFRTPQGKRLYESTDDGRWQADTNPISETFPVLIGAGHAPQALENALIGQEVGDSGTVAIDRSTLDVPAFLWKADPDLASPTVLDMLSQSGIRTAQELAELDTDDIASLTPNIERHQPRVIGSLEQQLLIEYEIVDAYRWPSGEGLLEHESEPQTSVMDGWPTFRGNVSRTGHTDVAVPWTEIRRRWVVDLGGRITSSPVLSDGMLCIGTKEGEVYTLDAETGDMEWSFATAGRFRHAPSTDGDMLWVSDSQEGVYALDFDSGEEAWHFETKRARTCPAVVEDSVIVGGYEEGAVLYSLDTESGEVEWRFEVPDSHGMNEIVSSPAVRGNLVYVGCDEGTLFALDASTGEERWKYQTGETIRTTPAATSDTVYVGNDGGAVYTVDAESGQQRWKSEPSSGVRSSPAVSADRIFFGTQDGTFRAVNRNTGDTVWEYGMAGPMDMYSIRSSPVVVQESVIFGGGDGVLYALDRQLGEEQWTHDLGVAIRSSPAVVDETIYISDTGGKLYAIGESR